MNYISNRRAEIGQTFTSFPALILLFFIMLIFVVIASFLSKDISNIELSSESSPDAVALLRLFLQKKVDTSSFGVASISGAVSVYDLIDSLSAFTDDSQQKKTIDLLQKTFDLDYSCGGENKLKITGFYTASVGGGGRTAQKSFRKEFFDYPVTLNDNREYPLLGKEVDGSVIGGDPYIKSFCEEHLGNYFGASQLIISKNTLPISICVYLEVESGC